jgi:hypothetical protein
MPLQNRVLPTGEIVAHSARGMFMGNRGRIHRPDQTLGVKRWALDAWLVCLTCFRGRKRTVWGNSYTELFFHDEAVALAAGHRPCHECRREAFRLFQLAWRRAHGEPTAAPAMNRRMHADRVGPGRRQRRHEARLGELPDGTFILDGEQPALVWRGRLHPFAPEGYLAPVRAEPERIVTVLTPRSTVNVLRAGYRPVLGPLATP